MVENQRKNNIVYRQSNNLLDMKTYTFLFTVTVALAAGLGLLPVCFFSAAGLGDGVDDLLLAGDDAGEDDADFDLPLALY